jgi:hypothetical protein
MDHHPLDPTSPLWPTVCGALVLACLRTDASGFVILASLSAAGLLLCSCVAPDEDGGDGAAASARVTGMSVPNARYQPPDVPRAEDDATDGPAPVAHDPPSVESSSSAPSRGHAAMAPPRRDDASQRRLREALFNDLFEKA